MAVDQEGQALGDSFLDIGQELINPGRVAWVHWGLVWDLIVH